MRAQSRSWKYHRHSPMRRQVVTGLVLAITWAAGAMAAESASPCPLATPPGEPPRMVLSLTVLQAEGHTGRLSTLARQLGGLTRIRGVFLDGNEILLLGDAEAERPPQDVSDLAAVLRNAFRTDSPYGGVAPGVTIDPMPDAADPWAIQEVKVLGLPREAIAQRFVEEDYLLKKVGAAITELADGVSGTFAVVRADLARCARRPDTKPTEVTHRFWFHARRPDGPRFEDGGDIVLIQRPIGVELLTEREFLHQSGQRQSAGVAAPEASQFADAVTCLLTTDVRPAYVRMRSDFALVELSRLLRFKGVSPEKLAYLLFEHPIAEVDIPRFVGGIRRHEQGEFVCDHAVHEWAESRGTSIQVTSDVRRYDVSYRGGVDADVPITPADVPRVAPVTFDELRRRIRASRPNPEALVWTIDYRR